MKWIDIPPVWLLVCLTLTYVLAGIGPFAGLLGHAFFDGIGAFVIAVGLALMVLAVLKMRAHNTTVIPHLEADTLVQSGIFARTRNPIYLGDVLVLLGCLLRWDAVLALPLIPALVWILQQRFILPEEARLRRAFGPDFASYAQKTRRWI